MLETYKIFFYKILNAAIVLGRMTFGCENHFLSRSLWFRYIQPVENIHQLHTNFQHKFYEMGSSLWGLWSPPLFGPGHK